jgi:hypothetical protein
VKIKRQHVQAVSHALRATATSRWQQPPALARPGSIPLRFASRTPGSSTDLHLCVVQEGFLRWCEPVVTSPVDGTPDDHSSGSDRTSAIVRSAVRLFGVRATSVYTRLVRQPSARDPRLDSTAGGGESSKATTGSRRTSGRSAVVERQRNHADDNATDAPHIT